MSQGRARTFDYHNRLESSAKTQIKAHIMRLTAIRTVAIPLLLSAAFAPLPAFACASCGCSLSSDWDSQGVSSSPGLKLDLRYDFVNQSQYRSGNKAVSYDPATGAENETYTRNHYYTIGLDYAFGSVWGVNVQLPYIVRKHETNGEPIIDITVPDGLGNPGVQDTKKIGDAKVIFRYAGFGDHNFGVQVGLKLPTGSHSETFTSGFNAGELVDQGLQPGTGSTDLILGAFYSGTINRDWDYFGQGVYETVLKHTDVYKPGHSLNVNFGVRYMSFAGFTPQLQINTRFISKDYLGDSTGFTIDDNTGGRIAYLSPGVTFPVGEKVKLFAFVQLPIYQHLNGYQLAPKYTASLGARVGF
jgi:hypothetical protein